MKKTFNVLDFKLDYIIDQKPYYYRMSQYTGSDSLLELPETFCSQPIIEIASLSFENNQFLKILILNNQIKQIHQDSFKGIQDLVLYTPFNQNELDLSYISNVQVRYGYVGLHEENQIIYALFNDGTAIVVSHSLNEEKYTMFGRYGIMVEIPDFVLDYQVTEIEHYAFAHTLNVKNYILGRHIRKIGRYAFLNNETLERFYIPDQVTEVGEYCFKDCINLKLLEVPHGVKKMGKNLLEGVYKSIVLFEDEYINEDLIERSNLEEVPYMKGLITTIEKDSIQYALFKDQSAMIIDHSLNEITDLVIPNYIHHEEISYEVRRIAPFVFYECRYIRDVKLPQTITHIYLCAFAKSDLTHIDMPNEIIFLGEAIFSNCIYLKRLEIPKGIKKVPRGLCLRCMSLGALMLPKDLEVIEKEAFFEARALEYVEFPVSLRMIGESAFYGTKLIYVELGLLIEKIESMAFGDCDELTTMVILNDQVDVDEKIVTSFKHLTVFLAGDEETKVEKQLLKESKYRKRIFTGALKVVEAYGIKYLLTEYDIAIVVFYNPLTMGIHVPILDSISCLKVEKIQKNALKHAYRLVTLEIPATIRPFEHTFLEGCHQLETLVLPNSLESYQTHYTQGLSHCTVEIADYTDQIEINQLIQNVQEYVDFKGVINFYEIKHRFNLSYGRTQIVVSELKKNEEMNHKHRAGLSLVNKKMN
jgi:hypothetical protein